MIRDEIGSYLHRLFPICRSITGQGVRDTLAILQEIIPLTLIEIPSGEEVYDWTIPNEWNIRDAYIKDASGNRVIEFQRNNLHVVNYSCPVHQTLSFQELKAKLYTLPELPDAIPYRTTYYQHDWGFCLSQNQYDQLDPHDQYEVCIDAVLEPGSLTIGEYYLEGSGGGEFLISTYHCHPSMANDNLSGVLLTAFLARELETWRRYHSYRFLFLPETIGAIAYCAKNEDIIGNCDGGIIATNVGGPGEFSYKQSFETAHYLNRVIEHVFKIQDIPYRTYPFDLFGSDERQYSAPGIGLNTPSISKDKYQEFAYYHTSLDNLDFVKPQAIAESLQVYVSVIQALEANRVYANTITKGEVMLSKRDLYPKTGGALFQPAAGDQDLSELQAMLWLLYYADGNRQLIDIAEIIGVSLLELKRIAQNLVAKSVLREEPFH